MNTTNNNLSLKNQSFENFILSSTKDLEGVIKGSEPLAFEFYPVSTGNLHRKVELGEDSPEGSSHINRFESYFTGKFTRNNNSEVKFLKPEELEGQGYQAWVKRVFHFKSYLI
jgi:hypothetical protein